MSEARGSDDPDTLVQRLLKQLDDHTAALNQEEQEQARGWDDSATLVQRLLKQLDDQTAALNQKEQELERERKEKEWERNEKMMKVEELERERKALKTKERELKQECEEKNMLSTELKKERERWRLREHDLKQEQAKQLERQTVGNSGRFFHIKKPSRDLIEANHDAIAAKIILNLCGQSGLVYEALRQQFFLRRNFASFARALYWLSGLHKEPIDWSKFHEWLYILFNCRYYRA